MPIMSSFKHLSVVYSSPIIVVAVLISITITIEMRSQK